MSIVKLSNNGVKNATAFGSITGLGSMIFIKKLTASSSATLSFVDGSDGVVLDDTYKEYVFTFNNMHPATNTANFTFNLSTDSGSNYNVTKTTTWFQAYHKEDDSGAGLGYETGQDLAQSTAFQVINYGLGTDNDENCSGTLQLFSPSSSVFVKHFIATTNNSEASGYSVNGFMAGYGNTTSAVDAVRFQMSSGNIDAGDICLYGIA
jgi:hypothetical protein